MNKDEWRNKENQKYHDVFIRRFIKFYNKYSKVAELLKEDEKKGIIIEVKKNQTQKGVLLEKFTFNQWIESFDKYRLNNDKKEDKDGRYQQN